MFTGATATTDSYFFESNLTLFNGAFSCLGNEALLTDCPNVSTSCGHQNEAGVRCPVPCDETGALQLVGGETYLEGRVEVCEDGVWRTICQGELWSQEDAVVTCAQLGYSTLCMSFSNSKIMIFNMRNVHRIIIMLFTTSHQSVCIYNNLICIDKILFNFINSMNPCSVIKISCTFFCVQWFCFLSFDSCCCIWRLLFW